MVALLAVVGTFALLAVSSIYKGFVLTVLWRWFMVPVFGLPELSLVAAIGIGLVISFLTYQYITTKKEEDPWAAIGKAFAWAIFYPTLCLFIGWIVHLFM